MNAASAASAAPGGPAGFRRPPPPRAGSSASGGRFNRQGDAAKPPPLQTAAKPPPPQSAAPAKPPPLQTAAPTATPRSGSKPPAGAGAATPVAARPPIPSPAAADTRHQPDAKQSADPRVDRARQADAVLWSMYLEDNWHVERQDAETGLHISSKSQGKGRAKIWKCVGEIEAEPEKIMQMMLDAEAMPRWNKNVAVYRVVERIDASTDVLYCVSSTGFLGVVSPRDFVILRHCARRDPQHILISDSETQHASIGPPPKDGSIIRGKNGYGGIVIARGAKPGRSRVCWIINKDLGPVNGVLRGLIDTLFAGVFVDWVKQLRAALK
jgi:START domain